MALAEKEVTKKAQKWGNSIGIRIPKNMADSLHIEDDTNVAIKIEDGRLIIKPQIKEDLSLEEMLEKVTEENKHGEIDFGSPVGRELF